MVDLTNILLYRLHVANLIWCKSKHNIVLYYWYATFFVASSKVVIKSVMFILLLHHNISLLHTTCITIYWLNQPINFYSAHILYLRVSSLYHIFFIHELGDSIGIWASVYVYTLSLNAFLQVLFKMKGIFVNNTASRLLLLLLLFF